MDDAWRADARPLNPMTTWFITRHPGARHWAEQQRLAVDRYCAHLDPADVAAGDTVIGSLPVNLAAAVCARGARYLNLSLGQNVLLPFIDNFLGDLMQDKPPQCLECYFGFSANRVACRIEIGN